MFVYGPFVSKSLPFHCSKCIVSGVQFSAYEQHWVFFCLKLVEYYATQADFKCIGMYCEANVKVETSQDWTAD